MARVVFENISKKYDNSNKNVVENINLTIEDKEFLVLVGPSGCGKSTSLRMIAGLEEISGGKIYIDDKVVNDLPPKDRDIAMVFQNYALYPHMNVYDNMAFSLKMKKVPKEEIKEKVMIAAKMLEIEDLLKRKPGQLSGGQRQRVALGRAVVRSPKVFLMDEPLSNLDAKLRTQMRTELLKLHKRVQTTIIYVTHDQVEAMTMGDRIVILDKGIIQQVDTPLNIYNYPNNMFVAGFIGSPAMNFMKCKLVLENGKYALINGEIRILLNDEQITNKVKDYLDKEVIMGIRPEDIYDSANLEDFTGSKKNDVVISIEVVEPLGSETLVHLAMGGSSIKAKIPSNLALKAGEKMKILFDERKIQLFDPTTEQNISISHIS